MEKITAKLRSALRVLGNPALHRSLWCLQVGEEFAGNHGSRALDADGVLFGGACCDRDRARTHAELAQRPARLLGQRGDGRHCRHSFHSVRLDPRIRTVVAGPAWSGALDRGFSTYGPLADGRQDVLANLSHQVAGWRPPLLAELHTPKRNQRPDTKESNGLRIYSDDGGRPSNFGGLAKLAAMRCASSRVTNSADHARGVIS